MLVERLLKALQHPGFPILKLINLAANLIQVAMHLEFAGLVLLFGNQLCQLVVKEPSLLQVAFLLSQQLRLLIIDCKVSHARLLSLPFDVQVLLLLPLAVGFEDKHVLVGDF